MPIDIISNLPMMDSMLEFLPLVMIIGILVIVIKIVGGSMRGNSEDMLIWIGGLFLAVLMFPTITGIIFQEAPESPCLESVIMECDKWSPECNINETVEVVSGPFYDQTIEEVEVYKREACIEWQNGTRVMP